ncbi:hypothetical protein IT415_03220 [bacterium]|nr:hypothetical protein [bacterium]
MPSTAELTNNSEVDGQEGPDRAARLSSDLRHILARQEVELYRDYKIVLRRARVKLERPRRG